MVQRVDVILTFFADIAFPGGKIGQGDHASARKSEIGYRHAVHLADVAAAAGDGMGGSLVMSHNVFKISRMEIIKQIG